MTTLLFDCDGVLADTERDGHRAAFNRTFADFGVGVEWDDATYAEKLKVGGGKERMASLFEDAELVASAGLPTDDDEKTALLAAWHRVKTAHFTELVNSGAIPPRPGIARLIPEALAAGWRVAVCSTSAEASVRAVLTRAVGADLAAQIPVFAGDVVPAKKPDPAIYTLAIEQLNLDPADTLVVEDSRNGLLAATRAGLPCLVTVSGYTREEDFSEAALVVSSLGDPGGEAVEVLANRSSARPGAFLTLTDLADCLTRNGSQPSEEIHEGSLE